MGISVLHQWWAAFCDCRTLRLGGVHRAVAYPGILFVGVSTNSVEGRENGDLGTVAP